MNEKKIQLIIGYPGSGKTRLAKKFENQGFARLDRDDIGGKMDDLANHMKNLCQKDTYSQFVLDNTYATVKSRIPVIQWAKQNGFEIEYQWIAADVPDAQYNVVKRIIDIYG